MQYLDEGAIRSVLRWDNLISTVEQAPASSRVLIVVPFRAGLGRPSQLDSEDGVAIPDTLSAY